MNRCVGVVLSVLAFRESDQIVTVFSPGGLIKFFVKRKRSPLFSVLTEGEFVYLAGQGEMHRFRDGTILQQHLKLRERFESLEAAGRLVQAIQKSQLPGKAAPQLYELFCYFLRMIPEVEHPLDLASIFLVKTLKYEGLLQQQKHCSICKKLSQARYGGERFCLEHAPNGALELSSEDEERLTTWAEGRSLKKLLEIHVPWDCISTFFNQAFTY